MNPDDPFPLEEQFISWLVACDEAVARGTPPPPLDEVADTPELRPRLERGMACLQLLDQLWSPPLGPPAAPPTRLGRFTIRRELGRGGFGIVYLAHDPRLQRDVALKIPRADVLATAAQRRLFQHEAQAAARLDHPNLVPVYEAGEEGEISYIASAYCPGLTLAAWLRQCSQPVGARLASATLATLAGAVQHAHSRGVLHRDLKPANILLSAERGAQSAEDDEGARSAPGAPRSALGAIPKITDFGLAKCLEQDTPAANLQPGSPAYPTLPSLTRSGTVMGTASYMAPEQAGRKAGQVTTAADIYALGAILYELLTGRPPFKGETVLDTLEQVRSHEPVPPSRLQAGVPADLEAICLKCLQKEPANRYASALALEEDLNRFLAGEPIQARPTGRWERGVKWARRRPAAAALLGVIALAGLVLLIAGVWFTDQLRAERNHAVRQEARARQERDKVRAEHEAGRHLLYAAHIHLAHQAWRDAEIERVLEFLHSPGCLPAQKDQANLSGWEWHYLRGLCGRDLRTLIGHPRRVFSLAFSPDGRRLASAGRDGTVRLWDPESGQELRILTGHTSLVLGVAFSPNGQWLASAGFDKTVRVWDAQTGKALRLILHPNLVTCVAFSPDSRLLASGSYGQTVRLWDPTTGKMVAELKGHAEVHSVAFSPTDGLLAAASNDGSIKVWNVVTRRMVHDLRGHKGSVRSVAFSRDGKFLASAGYDDTVRLWDPAAGKPIRILTGHRGFVLRVAFSPDGRLLASASSDRTMKVWNPTTGQEILTLRGHRGGVSSVAFAPDSRRLASGGRQIKLWDTAAGPQEVRILKSRSKFMFSGLVFKGPGVHLMAASDDGAIQLWDPADGREFRSLSLPAGSARRPTFQPDGTQLARIGWEGKTPVVQLCDTTTGKIQRTFRGHEQPVDTLAYRPNGRLLAGGTAGVWDAPQRRFVDGLVYLWDPANGRLLRTLLGHDGPIRGLAFSPNGRRLVSAGADQTIRIWDPATGKQISYVQRQGPVVQTLVFSPDGRLLATAGAGIVKLWDLGSGRVLHTLWKKVDGLAPLAFSPDGRRLAAAGSGVVKLWDTVSGQETITLEAHKATFSNLAFSADGRFLASGGWDGIGNTVRIWDAPQRRVRGAIARE